MHPGQHHPYSVVHRDPIRSNGHGQTWTVAGHGTIRVAQGPPGWDERAGEGGQAPVDAPALVPASTATSSDRLRLSPAQSPDVPPSANPLPRSFSQTSTCTPQGPALVLRAFLSAVEAAEDISRAPSQRIDTRRPPQQVGRVGMRRIAHAQVASSNSPLAQAGMPNSPQ